MFDLFTKKVVVGVDAGQFSVKVAMFAENGKDLHLVEEQVLPGRAQRDQAASDEATVAVLNSAVHACTSSRPKVKTTIVAAFQGEGAICFYQELPKLKKEELELATRSAAVKQIPFPLNEAFISSLSVPPLGPDKNKSAVFVVALKKALIDTHVGLYRKSDLAVERVDICYMPVIRCLGADHPAVAGEFFAVVHVGHTLTSVTVLEGANPYYNRDFAIAGRDFTYAIQMGAQNTWAEAEAYKHGYDATARDVPVEPILSKWLDQVKRSIGAFTKQFRSQNLGVARVLLSGGSARWKGLDVRLSEVLGLPVRVDAWERLRPDTASANAAAGAFRIAAGLSL